MTARLTVLDGVRWDGVPLPGGRTHALLAALAVAGGRSVGESALVEQVWGPDDQPANPGKALQVVVSRARAQTEASVVVRGDRGYRLGLSVADVDALVLRAEMAAAREAEGHGDAVGARDHARAALGVSVGTGGAGSSADLYAAAARDHQTAEAVLARALSVLGDDAEALPLLDAAITAGADDEPTLTALLRSTAAVRGAPAALDRYEALRAELADRLGVDPGPALRAVHAELLAADHPVRSGLRFDAASLVGRDEDLRALRALVREARVVSILGPGGLGKTRLANLLAADAEQSVVHVVELVGVASAEDVVGEVGSALGVRDSLTGRRTLTPEQRRDVRSRIAQALDQAPTLLVLDNCEHVVEAVADLVAYLVATVRRLRVVTTTRAPLSISAERVFALGQLAEDDGVDLFTQRALAARPGVALDDGAGGAVRRVVGRLDGLPLAIELAAAKVRVMSVDDIDRRLDDRFALLRGGDRSAPDRHQTLVAVIDWSWNLLTESQRRALRWLSVFADGFTLDGAAAVLGPGAFDDVLALVDQSLLTVLESDGGVRYRMLETVREFGRMQLVGTGDDVAARAAQLTWACDLARGEAARMWGPDQISAVRAIVAEENNLTDCLRVALADPDAAAVVALTSALCWMWTVRGENIRVMTISGAVDAVLTGWDPPDDLLDLTIQSAAVVVMNGMFGRMTALPTCRALLRDRRSQVHSVRVRGLADVVMAEQGDVDVALSELRAIATERAVGDPATAAVARLWAANQLENSGDPEGALVEAELGLTLLSASPDPWLGTLAHTVIASLYASLGRHARAAEHARLALPVLELLGAGDDVAQTRGLIVLDAIAAGRLDDAAGEIEQMARVASDQSFFGGAFLLRGCRAELALARGDVAEGLDRYRGALAGASALVFPDLGDESDTAPWLLYGEAAATAAYARYGTVLPAAPSSDRPNDGRDLRDALARKIDLVFRPDRPHMDYPIAGLAVFALAAWELLIGESRSEPTGWTRETAVRLLVLADRLACPRSVPSLEPTQSEAAADAAVPGLRDRARAEYDGLRGAELLAVVRGILATLPS